jgi:hypothetical protein
MEVGMIVVLGLALLFISGIIYLILKERNNDTSEIAEIPIWVQDSKPPAKKEKKK